MFVACLCNKGDFLMMRLIFYDAFHGPQQIVQNVDEFSSLLNTLNILCCLCTFTRVGNFIIGASGSDKQMLCASSGARAALIIAVKYCQQKGRFVIRRKILFLSGRILKKRRMS